MNIEEPSKKKEPFVHDFKVEMGNRGSGVLTESRSWGPRWGYRVPEEADSPAKQI